MRDAIVRMITDFLNGKTLPSEFQTELIEIWRELVDLGWKGESPLSAAEQAIADEIHSVCFSFTEDFELIENDPELYIDEGIFRREIKRLLGEFLAAEPNANDL